MALTAIVLPALALSACGGSDDGDGVASAGKSAANGAPAASPSQSLSARDAQLKFAQCMRENGINVPDPEPGQPARITGSGLDRGKLEGATKKCQPYLQAGGQAGNPDDPKARDAMLKFAKCMRENGINVPDPKPGEGIRMQAPGGSQAKAEAAQKACQKYLPGAMQGGPGQGQGGAGQ